MRANQAVRPPIVADLNLRPQPGHCRLCRRCGSSHDLGMTIHISFGLDCPFQNVARRAKEFRDCFYRCRVETCVAG